MNENFPLLPALYLPSVASTFPFPNAFPTAPLLENLNNDETYSIELDGPALKLFPLLLDYLSSILLLIPVKN